MSFQPGAVVYTQSFGSRPENVEVPHIDTRAPTVNDVGPFYPIGKRWIYVGTGEYTLLSISTIGGVAQANWSLLGTTGGALNTLTGDAGGGIAPVANNITLAGTGSQITTTGAAGTITLSIPAIFIAPGTIRSTTTLTAGTSLAVTTSAAIGTTLAVTGTTTLAAVNATAGTFSTTLGVTGLSTLAATNIVGTTNINVSGAAVTTIGTGGTGAVNIGNATGNTSITGTLLTSAGITATTGNLTLNGVTSKINISVAAPATASVGTTAALVAGSLVVNTSAISANSLVFFTTNALGTVLIPQSYRVSARVAGVSFTIESSDATDTSTVNYWIIN